MATATTLSQAELLQRLCLIASSHGGTSSMPDDHTVTGTLTAINAKWLLGGRKVTSNFTCALDPTTHDAPLSGVSRREFVGPAAADFQCPDHDPMRCPRERDPRGQGLRWGRDS